MSKNKNIVVFGRHRGETDDTKAVQRCIDAAAGKKFFIPPGTYLIGKPLLIGNHKR